MKDSKLLVAVKKLPSDRMKHPASEPAWWMPSSRSFLGQAEGDRVAEYLNCLPRVGARRHPFLRSLSIHQEYLQAMRRQDKAAMCRLRKPGGGAHFAYYSLISAAKPKRLNQLQVTLTKDGLLILQPATPEGKAAVALLALIQKARVDRIRRCRRCRTWFYARFKHQQFCRDPKKKCQSRHYHSPEWRRKNRERNRKHQRDYRVRNPSRRKTRLAELTRIADPFGGGASSPLTPTAPRSG
jgi:hypothetical protein